MKSIHFVTSTYQWLFALQIIDDLPQLHSLLISTKTSATCVGNDCILLFSGIMVSYCSQPHNAHYVHLNQFLFELFFAVIWILRNDLAWVNEFLHKFERHNDSAKGTAAQRKKVHRTSTASRDWQTITNFSFLARSIKIASRTFLNTHILQFLSSIPLWPTVVTPAEIRYKLHLRSKWSFMPWHHSWEKSRLLVSQAWSWVKKDKMGSSVVCATIFCSDYIMALEFASVRLCAGSWSSHCKSQTNNNASIWQIS